MGKVKKEEARSALCNAKTLLNKSDYKGAKASIEFAIRLDPDVEHGLSMSILCETLFYGVHNLFPNLGIDWYSLLHLHPCVSLRQVESHVEKLISITSSLTSFKIHCFRTAFRLLKRAVSIFLCKTQRLEFDEKRKESGLVDSPMTKIVGKSFKEIYLGWTPPVFSIDDDSDADIRSNKRARTDTPESCVSVSGSIIGVSPGPGKLEDQVFNEMPDWDFTTDVAFVKFYQEIERLESPESFWCKEDGLAKRLKEFEGKGYGVEKLRERLETLKGFAECDQACREARDKFEVEVREGEKKMEEEIGLLKKTMERFEAEFKVHEKRIAKCQSEIGKRACKIDHLRMISVEALEKFTSTAAKSMLR